MNELHANLQTHDVLPDGIMVQLRSCRGRASLQKGRSRISTPAPSDGNRYVRFQALTNGEKPLRSATTDARGASCDSRGGLTKNAVGVNSE